MGRGDETGNRKGCDGYQDSQYAGPVTSLLQSPAIPFNVNTTKGAIPVIRLFEPAFWANHIADLHRFFLSGDCFKFFQ